MKKPKKERKKFRISTLTALMLRFGILLFILIYGAIAILTIYVCKDLTRQWEENFNLYAGHAISTKHDEYITQSEMLDRCWAYEWTTSAHYSLPTLRDLVSSSYNVHYGRDISYAFAFYDTGMYFDNPGISAETHVYINYITEETWSNCILKPDGEVVLKDFEKPRGLSNVVAYKFKGYYEDGFFVPVWAAYCQQFNAHLLLQNVPTRDQQGMVTWRLIFDHTANCEKELVTLYSEQIHSKIHINDGNSGGPVEANGRTYASVQEMAEIGDLSYYRDYNFQETVFAQSISHVNEQGEPVKQTTVLRCYPLKLAMYELDTVYKISFLVFVGILVLYYLTLRRQMQTPLRRIITSGEDFRPLNWGGRSRWREVAQLEDGYELTQKTIHDLRQENQQLRTALEYAQEAEVRRRDLVSGITHDLKTPLAIIHSYAEGLEAGIAPEKQSQYLQTILDEADRMDGMVLEMLDFSRLEAGKVTLATDQFSLLALTKRVFDRLDLQLQEKNLAVHFDIAEDFLTTADESRIEQVVTNFATNAIKFSPEGGEIHLNIFQHTGKTMFTIANQCENLPEETLERIWDSFYRADSSRTVKGTGLGLPIARAVIHLHRGTCEARNTSTGVEFRFMLPQ